MELQISALENGIVIDHIPSHKLYSIVKLLNLKEYSEVTTVGFNLKSKSLGKKGLIKIADKELDEEELGKIAILAPNVTINIIKNYKAVAKKKLSIPSEIIGIIKCDNSKCISNHEKISSKFLNVSEGDNKKYKCYYCERVTTQNEIKLVESQ